MDQFKTPLSSYVATGIEGKTEGDVLPFNAGVNGSITDNYTEFR